MKELLGWLLALVLGFSAGVSASRDPQRDTELEQKVQAHMDVIVDEAAGIVDDVSAAAEERRETFESELKDTDAYKKTEEFVNDVQEIAENTKLDIEEHFSDETEEETEAETEAETASA
jgi:hypothetical protein